MRYAEPREPQYLEPWDADDGPRANIAAASIRRRGEPSLEWMIAGAVALGMGILFWNYIGRDVRRYLKIRNM